MQEGVGKWSVIAVVLTVVLSALLRTLFSAHTDLLNDVTEDAGNAISDPLGIPVANEVIGVLIISIPLVLLWGVAYYYVRSNSLEEKKPENIQASELLDEDEEYSYQTPAVAQLSDENLRAELGTRLENTLSAMDDIYDRLVDADKRERAEHVASAREDIAQLERTVAQNSDHASLSNRMTDRRKEQLRTTHESLLDTTDDLRGRVDEVHQSTATEVNREFVEEIQRLVQRIDSLLTKRQTTLKNR